MNYISLLTLALSMPAMAQNDSLQSTILNPVVITGTGTYHKAKNSPVAVKVISAKELKDAQVTSVQETLSRLTSDITLHTNGMGTFVNFNGVSDDYLLLMVNGKRVSGDDRWDRVSLDNVKRIEIYNGAASALYGSDALAGVVNIITDDSKDRVHATSSTKVMNHGRLTQDINVDANVGSFGSQTSYTHRQANGWQVSNQQAFDEGEAQVLKLTGRPMSVGYQSDNVSQRFDWKINRQWSAYLRGDYYDYGTERPQSATYFTQKVTTDKVTGEKTYNYTEKAAYTYDLHHKSYLYGGGLRFTPNERTHLYLDVYSDNFVSKYDYWQTAQKEAYEETRKRTHYTNETLKGIFRLADWNKLSAGVEMVQETLNSQSDNIDFETTGTYNVFAQDELQLPGGLEAVVGLRYTYNTGFGSALTPNAALFYHISGFALRASYASGYRTPTLSQLYATDQAKTTSRYTLSNPMLHPEKNHFWKVNAEYQNRWMSVSVSGFINEIRDMINYRVLTDEEIKADAHLTALHETDGWQTLRQRDNIDRASLRGVSAQLKFILPYGFSLNGSYTFTDSKSKTRTLDSKTQAYVTTENPVDKSVRHVGNVTATWDKTWNRYHLNVTLNGHLQGERYSSTYGYAPAYQQWDISTRHTFRLDHFSLEPGLGIENVFNQRDTSYWNSNFSTINPGRSVYVSLRLRY